jgi:hypothetical protein
MERGVDTTIATFNECVINMERTLRFNPDGTSVESPDVTVRFYRPSQERLRRLLLKKLGTAPRGSPYQRLAEDMRLAHNLNTTTDDIINLMRDYKDNGHDTFKVHRTPDEQRYRRSPFASPGNKGERYYGGYRGSHASLEEEDEEYYEHQDLGVSSILHLPPPSSFHS